jgi:hypothetical protein
MWEIDELLDQVLEDERIAILQEMREREETAIDSGRSIESARSDAQSKLTRLRSRGSTPRKDSL